MRTLRLRQTWPLHALIFPGVLVTLVFHVFPLIGFSIAFQDYNPTKGFLGSAWIGLSHFRYMLSFPDTVVVFRNTILIAGVNFLAAIVTIDQQQYEAAYMDGASRLQQAFHVTLPNMAPIIVLMSVLAVGSILSAGFDQIFNLYNPLVYEVSDIIDTFVYRVGLLNAQFSIATAMGMLKSIVAMVLVLASFKIAEKYGNYEIF